MLLEILPESILDFLGLFILGYNKNIVVTKGCGFGHKPRAGSGQIPPAAFPLGPVLDPVSISELTCRPISKMAPPISLGSWIKKEQRRKERSALLYSSS